MFVPIGDDNSRRRLVPFVTWGLLAANAAAWAVQLHFGDSVTHGWATVPYEIVHNVDLTGPQPIEVGTQTAVIEHYPGPTPIRLTVLSSMFLHGSWMHIIGNMVYLLIFADQIEDRLGRFRFLLFYILCGLGAAVAQILGDPESRIPCIGASGAIAGCLGAYLVTEPMNGVRVLVLNRLAVLPAFVVLGGWAVLQVLGQVSAVPGQGGVAYLAHLGGFAAGVVLVFLLGIGRPARPA